MGSAVSSTVSAVLRRGWQPGREGQVRWPRARRRRSVPHLLAGLVLVPVCAVATVVVTGRVGDRVPVLAMARPVAAGQVLGRADVRTVQVAADPGLDLVPASAASSVLGRPAAVPLTAGALLTGAAVGASQVPADGQAIVAVAVKAGQFPPEVSAGSRVAVVITRSQEGMPSGSVPIAGPAPVTGSRSAGPEPVAGWSATGVVLGVERDLDVGAAVMSLQLSEAQAVRVAGVPVGSLSLVLLPGSR